MTQQYQNFGNNSFANKTGGFQQQGNMPNSPFLQSIGGNQLPMGNAPGNKDFFAANGANPGDKHNQDPFKRLLNIQQLGTVGQA